MLIVLTPLLTMVGTCVLLVALLQWQALLPIDHPNDRSLHAAPIPRIGGLGVIPVPVLVLLIAGVVGDSMLMMVMIGIGILFFISLLDDYQDLPAGLRFVTQIVVAYVFSVQFGSVFFWSALMAIAIVWMTNLYNFMDGANGLAGGMTVVGFGAYAVAAYMFGDVMLAATCLAFVGAGIAFLFFNFGTPKLFLGDAGSIPLGFLAGALGLMGVQRGIWPMWFPCLVFSSFLIDASVTLIRRVFTGQRFWLPHREHYYQRLIRMGWGHKRLALYEYGFMGVSAVLAVLLLTQGGFIQCAGLISFCIVSCSLLFVIDHCWHKFKMGVECE